MRAFPSTNALTALRELPAAALRSAPPGLQAPLRRTLRTGQRAGQVAQRMAWYALLSALVLLAPPTRAQAAAPSTQAESPTFSCRAHSPAWRRCR